MGAEPRTRSKVVCLLPVRDSEALLPGWFASVAPFTDAVIALEDGSVDGTLAVLEANPLVARVLRNEPREGFAGWDDSANRRRLLRAAAELEPDWIISIDADQLVAPEEGVRLRRFIDHHAVPGYAYGFQSYRMVDDTEHHDGIDSRVYRLFHYDPQHDFSLDRLHFTPVPTAIPSSRWLAANIGIQHLAGLTPEHRARRRHKYAEADPEHRWEADYSYIDTPTGIVRRWRHRSPDEPFVLESHFVDWSVVEPEFEWPTLSLVFVVDDHNVGEAIEAHDQATAITEPGVEVLLVARDGDVATDIVAERPAAFVITGPGGFTAAGARNAGLRSARGDYVLFADSAVEFTAAGARALVAIHDRGHAVVAFPRVEPAPSATGWATYFDEPCGFSFAREPLLQLRGFHEGAADGIERVARDRLLSRGHHAGHTALVTARHRTELRSRGELLRDRFAQGAAISADGLAGFTDVRRADAAALRRLRHDLLVARSPEEVAAYRRVGPLVRAAAAARWLGAARNTVRR